MSSILGLGIDLCDIRRVEKLLVRHGERFMQKYFTNAERAYAMRQPHPAAALARRWAAKEAAAKALGTGFRDGLFMRDIEITNDANGKPHLLFHNQATELLVNLMPHASSGFALCATPDKRLTPIAHLALTDEYPYALAQVIISAIPKET